MENVLRLLLKLTGIPAALMALGAQIDNVAFLIKENRIIMVQGISDLDTAIANLDATIAGLSDAVGTLSESANKLDGDVAALAAKVTGGESVDVSAEVAKIQGQTQALANITTTLKVALSQVQSADQAAAPSGNADAPAAAEQTASEQSSAEAASTEPAAEAPVADTAAPETAE